MYLPTRDFKEQPKIWLISSFAIKLTQIRATRKIEENTQIPKQDGKLITIRFKNEILW